MFVKSIAFVACLASFTAAQTTNVTFNPATVDPAMRAEWCNAQINTCGTLCAGDADPNNCDSDTLAYNCLCAANSSAPGLEFYQQTVPSFICQQTYADCITANAGNQAGQIVCTQNRSKCGTLIANATDFLSVSTSSVASTSTAPPTSETSAAATTTSSSSAAGATMAVGRGVGTGVFAAGAAAAFGLLL